MQQYYQTLGVSRTATVDDIKKAFRQKAKVLHPDVNKAPNAEESFKSMMTAYNWLLSHHKSQAGPSKFSKYRAFSVIRPQDLARMPNGDVKSILTVPKEYLVYGAVVSIMFNAHEMRLIIQPNTNEGTLYSYVFGERVVDFITKRAIIMQRKMYIQVQVDDTIF